MIEGIKLGSAIDLWVLERIWLSSRISLSYGSLSEVVNVEVSSSIHLAVLYPIKDAIRFGWLTFEVKTNRKYIG